MIQLKDQCNKLCQSCEIRREGREGYFYEVQRNFQVEDKVFAWIKFNPLISV